MELPDLLSPQDVKRYLGCSDKTIYTLCKRRDFPAFRIGGRYYINKSDLSEWIKKESKKK